MADWDSVDLLLRLRDAVARPATDAALTSDRGYRLLSDAQRDVGYTLAQHIPWVNYGAPVQLTTSDQKVYTLPGDPTPEWMGRLLVMRTLDGEPLLEGGYDDWGADYCVEGVASIRITAGRTWTGDAPYVRYMAKPGAISDTLPPTLLPLDVRAAVVWTAAALFARRGGLRDAQPYLDQAYTILWGNPATGQPGLIPSYKDQQSGAGAVTPWWRILGRG